MIFDVFIRRPRLAMVISIVITLAGIIAMQVLPVAQYPEIAPPTVSVTAAYSGADAKTVEESIAQPLENAINGVDGMRYMKSTSANDGSYSLTVSFLLGTDPDIDTVNVQNRANLVTAKLPEEVRRTGLTIAKVSTDLLQVFLFYSPDKTRDELFLSNFVTINVLDELKRVPGVGNASIFGARDYSMRIWIDPEKLANFNLSAQDVIAAIQSQNLQAAAGRIGAAPLSADQRLQLTITTKGRLVSAEEFGAIIVRAAGDGAFVRVRDIGRVEIEGESFDSTSSYNGEPASPIGIYLSPGANAVSVAEAVVEAPRRAQAPLPDRRRLCLCLQHRRFRLGHDREGHPHADRGVRPRGHRRVRIPRPLPAHAHSAHCRARRHHRRARGAAGLGLLRQYHLSARPRSRHRHRRR